MSVSNAQAMLLGCLDDHDSRDEPVYFYPNERSGQVMLLTIANNPRPRSTGPFDIDIDEDATVFDACSLHGARQATIDSCIRRELVEHGGVTTFRTQLLGNLGFFSPKPATLHRLLLTDPGRAALLAYRQRPLPEVPALGGIERDVIELAVRAERLGYALVPATDEAKRAARALARTPYAKRGYGGGPSTRSLRATATGEVAVTEAVRS